MRRIAQTAALVCGLAWPAFAGAPAKTCTPGFWASWDEYEGYVLILDNARERIEIRKGRGRNRRFVTVDGEISKCLVARPDNPFAAVWVPVDRIHQITPPNRSR